MLSAQRLAILVDSENLEITAAQNYSSGKSHGAQRRVFPNWKVIIPEIVGKRALVRNIYYKQKGQRISEKFRKFWTEQCSGEIRHVTKSADPYIIIDAISIAPRVDVVVILAGDKDYLPVISYLQAHGCKVEIASFPQAVARSVKTAADHFFPLRRQHTITLERSR